MKDLGFPTGAWTESCACAAGLEVCEIGAGGDFEPAFLATGPDFEVVLF